MTLQQCNDEPSKHLTRRTALCGLSVGLAASTVPGASRSASSRPAPGCIDTHHHFLPDVYVAAVGVDKLSQSMPNGRVPNWSSASAMDLMDANGIAEGILSISAGPPVPDPVSTLRKCNDAAADLRARHAGRFGSFASLPLPDMAASLREIEYASDTLQADGFIVFSNYAGKYLGDRYFMPLLEELHRRRAVVFIHPTRPPYTIDGQSNPALIEFTFETTRCAFSLLLANVPQRFPHIRFVLSHAGGTLPYLATRIETVFGMEPKLREQVPDPLGVMRSFYFDTALSVGAASLAALREVADPARILFGTDYPMASEAVVRTTASGIRTLAADAVAMDGIARQNAARLLGRA